MSKITFKETWSMCVSLFRSKIRVIISYTSIFFSAQAQISIYDIIFFKCTIFSAHPYVNLM